jgi:WD40 repeat protein
MNPKTLTKVNEFKLPTAVLGASLSSDGNSLVAGCMDGVYIANLAEKSFERIGGHDSYVSSAAFLPSQNAIVSAGYDGVLQWFDVETKQSIRKQKVHDFWSWDMTVSPDQKLIASVTGQYLAGSYKYEPAPEREPSLRLIAADSGEVLHSLPHVPSVQSVCFSHDGRLVAAGNLMGEVRIWDCQTAHLISSFTTPDFTSWGIIKSHCYLGGIFALRFTPDDQALLLCGMGKMNDPMAGNGRQLWQKWSWKESPARMVDETHKDESGEGLMEALSIHPDGKYFAMGGRLRGGDWNVALFDLDNGNRMGTIKSDYRVTDLFFAPNRTQLVLVGTQGQPNERKKREEKKEGEPERDQEEFPAFGRIEVYDIT